MFTFVRCLLLAFGLLTPASAWEPAPWTRKDTWWEIGFVAVVAMDYGQSWQIVPLGRVERNPCLPRKPSPRTMGLICLGSVAGHFGVSCLLPAPWRRGWQVTTVFLEAATVTDNYCRAGLSIKF